MAQPTRYKDLLDYTISYKAVWMFLGVAVAFGVASAIAWSRLRPPTEDEKARQEVKSAERLWSRAEECARGTIRPEDQALYDKGRAELDAAQSSLDKRAWTDAQARARAAQEQLRGFVTHACNRESVAEVVMLQGDVKVKKANSPRWVGARKGPLAVGDRVRTESGVARIVYSGSEESIEVRPGTIVEIKDVVPRADGSLSTVSNIEDGAVIFRSIPNSSSTIETKHATIEPAGDTVGVETGAESSSVVSMGAGGAVVRSGTTVTTIARQQRIQADAAGLGPAKPWLGPPEPKEPLDGRIFSVDKPEDALVVFKWLPLEGAQGYVFQFARNEVFAPVLNEGEQELVSGTEVEVPIPPPNVYYWRVAGRDREQVRGAWSEMRRITVRGAGPQPGKGPPPPTIELGKPISFGDRIIVSGKTQQYVTLEAFLNGHKYSDITVDDAGGFQVLVTLSQEGRNLVEIVAHDTYGQETRVPVPAFFSTD